MRKTPVGIRSILVFLLGFFMVFTTASGYLYRQNRKYQHQNERLIILNDSILSENIELKNRLQLKGTAAMQNIRGSIKTREK